MDFFMVKDAILNGYEGPYTNSHAFPYNFLSKQVLPTVKQIENVTMTLSIKLQEANAELCFFALNNNL